MPHVDLALLQAVVDGSLPPKMLLRRLLDHLSELCPECGEAIAAVREGSVSKEQEAGQPVLPDRAAPAQEDRSVPSLPDPRFVGVLDRIQDNASEWTKRVRREQRRARADLQELRGLRPAARVQRVEQARSRFRSRSLAELLVEESRRVVREDPAEAQSFASLAQLVLLWTPGAIDQEWAQELGVKASAWGANALRVAGELRAADRRFQSIRARLAREALGSESLHAEICSLEASLRIDQGKLQESRDLLSQAAYLYEAAGDRQAIGRVLMKRAIVEGRDDELDAAAATQRRALTFLDRAQDPHLYLQATINLALYLNALERNEEAEALLVEHEGALRDHQMWRDSRLETLRGRLALARQDSTAAEELFLSARAGCLARHDALRAAVASFDLALLYLSQGRTGELRQMARLMGQVFESEDLHEEAMATVVLFQQAVAAESVTLEALRAWRRQLESGGSRARMRPPALPS